MKTKKYSFLLPCRICGKKPRYSSVLFMGHHVECCHCGIAIPFPPTPTKEQARIEWNKEQDQ